jgi:hypothetical protein
LTVYGLTELRLSVPEAGKRLLPLPIEMWRPDQRERFEAELRRLEEETRSDAEAASLQATHRSEAS